MPGALARGLVERGHQVTVLTGFPNYPSGHLADGYRLSARADEERDGVRVRRTWLYPSHDASMARRLLNYGSFGASSLILGVDALRDIDVLWVNYSPITVAPTMWWLHHRRDVPVVVHVLDLWPDTVTAGGFGGEGAAHRAVESAVSAWCARMYRSAATVAVNSPGVVDVLASRGVPRDKLAYVPLWADEQLWPAPLGAGPESRVVPGVDLADDDVVLLYAGSLGRAQGLDVLIEACARVGDPRLRCLIAGSGAEEDSLRRQAADLGVRNVDFLGRVAPESMPGLMAAADASFVALSPHPLSRITMPSKFQAGLAAGRCLVVSADGDLADAAAATGAAFVAPAADPAALAEVLERLCAAGRTELAALGTAARAAYDGGYAAGVGIDRVESLLAAALPDGGRTSAARGLQVRGMRAGDVRAAAALHRRAFPSFFLSALGEPFLREFYRGFLDDDTAVTAVVADAGGDLLGIVVGTTAPAGFFGRLLRRQLVGFAIASARAALRRPSSVVRLVRGVLYRGEESGEGALLSSICVDPAAQGRGVGGLLLGRWTEEASSRGATAAHLSTDADRNAEVNRFYRSHGWELRHEHTTREGRRMNVYQRSLGA
nr:glycosyltransferase family 4 protein [Nocardioides sp. MAH-18]